MLKTGILFVSYSWTSRPWGTMVGSGGVAVIRFNFRNLGKFDIARPTLLEIAGLGLVLSFFVVLALLWR